MFVRIRKIQGRPPFETVESPKHPQPRVLDHLLGHCRGGDVHPSDTEHRRLELFDEAHEGGLVPGPKTFDEGEIVR
jgi:hypothetical protein